ADLVPPIRPAHGREARIGLFERDVERVPHEHCDVTKAVGARRRVAGDAGGAELVVERPEPFAEAAPCGAGEELLARARRPLVGAEYVPVEPFVVPDELGPEGGVLLLRRLRHVRPPAGARSAPCNRGTRRGPGRASTRTPRACRAGRHAG